MLIGEKIQTVRDFLNQAKLALLNGNKDETLFKAGYALGVIHTLESCSNGVKEFIEIKLDEIRDILIACGGAQ